MFETGVIASVSLVHAEMHKQIRTFQYELLLIDQKLSSRRESIE